jgi:hypothetical protein
MIIVPKDLFGDNNTSIMMSREKVNTSTSRLNGDE